MCSAVSRVGFHHTVGLTHVFCLDTTTYLLSRRKPSRRMCAVETAIYSSLQDYTLQLLSMGRQAKLLPSLWLQQIQELLKSTNLSS